MFCGVLYLSGYIGAELHRVFRVRHHGRTEMGEPIGADANLKTISRSSITSGVHELSVSELSKMRIREAILRATEIRVCRQDQVTVGQYSERNSRHVNVQRILQQNYGFDGRVCTRFPERDSNDNIFVLTDYAGHERL